MTKTPLAAALLSAAAACLFAQDPAPLDQDISADETSGQQGIEPAKPVAPAKPAHKGGLRFDFKNHPSLRAGEWFRADLRLKFQHDFRTFDPEVTTDEGELSNLRKFRVGVEGYVTRSLEYVLEREIRNEVADFFNLRTRETQMEWRDVYANFRYFRRAQLRFGQFKIPFGLDQLKYGTNGEFVNRSLIGNFLAPGRDVGVMLHGRLSAGRIAWQAGLFRNDGWKAHDKEHERSAERTIAGRLVVPPFSFIPKPALKPLHDLELGFAVAESPVTEGMHSLRGRTWVITHPWFDRIFVRGHRLRVGTELNWEPGPFVAKGEYIKVRDERLGQGLRGEDLPNLIGQGWYFTTGWVVTGEKTAGGVRPRKDFVLGKGIGAIQIVGRYEQMRFGSAEHPGNPTRSSRGANLTAASERIATFGLNWYWNRFTRIQFNFLREVLEDPQKVPINGIDTYWSRYFRIQFVL